ncbi:MAG: hypothetical protein HRU15_14265, partial [Planctomycetes bacterium]|nr:hypothetical protein [Planctomycetota bacterium]
MRYLIIFVFLNVLSAHLHAAHMQPREIVSPIVGKTFTVNLVPFDSDNRDSLNNMPANMGVDSDGCRHHAGLSEYDHYIVTCPFTYFSAISVEWNERNGRFTQPL